MILGVRACMLTIRHYVTNTTDSQNAGALHEVMSWVVMDGDLADQAVSPRTA